MESHGLEEILGECGVQSHISSGLLAAGWTIENFSCVVSDASEMDRVFDELVPDTDVSLLQKSALRAAFKRCQSKMAPSGPLGSMEASASAEVPQSATSWSESFAPKLDQGKIVSLKEKFLQCYPSELINYDTMPSTRLLSLVYHQIQRKQWHWVPWKYRLTASKADELSQQRQAKLPKLEVASLHNLLVDEPPSIDISNGSMGINSVRNLLAVHDVAIAMCGGAHLANLKAYSHKFVSFLTQRIDADSMLRCASITESQAADRQIWGTLSELMTERGWSMDDSLHEMTHVRHDLPGLLQLRPRPPKTIPWQQPGNQSNWFGKGKGSKGGKDSGKGGKDWGKSGKDGGKGKGKVQWLTDIKTKDGTWKQLCMRWQSGKCTLGTQCKFQHSCAYPVNGVACGLDHGALQHQSTTH